MINAREELVPLRKSPPLFRGARPHVNTVRRWTIAGVRDPREDSAERVKLETLKIGERIYTSQQAVDRFLLAMNAPADSQRPSGEPSASLAKANAILDAAKI